MKASGRLAGRFSRETRYFISSLLTTAPQMLAAVRGPWGIENQRHWVLDRYFGEDQSRIRQGHAPANIAIIRHVAFNRITSAPTTQTNDTKSNQNS